MTQAQRASDLSSERDPEEAGRPTVAIVAGFAAAARELDRSQTAHPDLFIKLDRRHSRELRPSQQLLMQYMPDEVAWRGVILRLIAFLAA